MKYIDLNKLVEKDLLGEWEIYDRTSTKEEPDNVFFRFNTISFLSFGIFKLTDVAETQGRWKLVRQTEIIYNPQLKFQIGDKDMGKAIITRLYSTEENNRHISKLTLYFNTGLELILKKTE